MGKRPDATPCAAPWPTMPRSVPSSTSTWAGGNQASAVGLVPGTPCRTPDLPTLQPCGPCFLSAGLPPKHPRCGQGVGVWREEGNPRTSQPTRVPTERLCPGGQLYSDCASACPPSCSAVGEAGEGSCREACVSGCECPPGLFWDGGLCVPAARCPCYHRRRRYAPGDTVRQLCNPWWVRGPRWPLGWGWRPRGPLGALPYAISSTCVPFRGGAPHMAPVTSHGLIDGPA